MKKIDSDHEYEKTPSPFDSNVFEATCFALEVPKVVYELRRLGVNAQELNFENRLDQATLLAGWDDSYYTWTIWGD